MLVPWPVGRNKLAPFRQPYGKRTAAMPELRRLVPAYGSPGISEPRGLVAESVLQDLFHALDDLRQIVACDGWVNLKHQT